MVTSETGVATGADRCPEIDWLKGVCILTVVYIHCITVWFDPGNFAGYLAGDLCRFAVPGLFFAAGFLFDKRRDPIGRVIRKRLVRLALPYLFCSLVIQGLDLPGVTVRLGDLTAGQFAANLVFGNTLGIYYFVFVLIYFYAGSLVLRVVSRKWALGLWGLSALALLALQEGWVGRTVTFYQLLRHPFFHLFGYMSGWVFSLYYEAARSFLIKYRAGICAGCLVLMVFVAGYTRTDGNRFLSFPLLTQVYIYASIVLIITAGLTARPLPKGVRFLSDCSFGIYLLHFPIVRAFQMVWFELPVHYAFGYALAAWCAGLGGSLLIILLFRKLGGRYARYFIGC